MTAALRPSEPTTVNVALGNRAYDVVIGRGVAGIAWAPHRRAQARRAARDRHRRERRARASRRTRGAAFRRRNDRRAHRRSAGRGIEELRLVRTRLRCADRLQNRAQRPHRRLRRRRRGRPRRIRCRKRAARSRFRAGADHVAGAGRFFGGRQDRHQFAPRQETRRRVPSADLVLADTALLDTLPSATSAPATPSSRNSACLAMPASSPGWRRTGRTPSRAARRASTPSRSHAAARPQSWRATSARPASARC